MKEEGFLGRRGFWKKVGGMKEEGWRDEGRRFVWLIN